MSDKLNPCPVCGGVAVLEKHYHRRSPTTFSARCKYCCFGTVSSEDRGLVVETWNRLTPTDHIVDANKKVDDNPPLTLEELRGMGDELVWMEDWFTEAEKKEGYGFERASDVLTFDGWRHITNYGKMWRAYRRKPEEE